MISRRKGALIVASRSVSDAYFQEIEALFALRRGTPFILSAKDWALMKSWHDEGVPLPVVIEAIDSVFEKNETSGRRKTISSLSYCRHAVKDLWAERKTLYVGGAEAVPESSPQVALDALAVELERGPAAAAAFAPRVRLLAAERSVPRIEEKLLELEGELLDALTTASPEILAELREEVRRSLGDTSRLDPATRLRTEQANLRRLTRDRFAIPRLTLF